MENNFYDRFDKNPFNKIFETTSMFNFKILRNCLWFYKEQIVSYAEMSKYFTIDAIDSLLTDNFIEKC